MRRGITLTLAGVLLLGLLAVCSGALLLGTSTGTRWLFGRLQGARPALVHCDGIEGSLFGALELRNLIVRQGDVVLEAARLRLEWHPAALLRGRLDLGPLRLEDARLSMPVDDAPPVPGLFPDLPLPPLSLKLRGLEVAGGTLRLGEDLWRVDVLALAGSMDAAGLHLDEGRLRLADHVLEVSGSMAAAAPHALQARVRGQAEVRGLGTVALTGGLGGDLVELRLEDIQLSGPLAMSVRGLLRPAEGPAFDLEGRWRHLRWPLVETPLLTSEAGQFRLTGRLADYRLELAGPVLHAAGPEATLSLEATGDAEALRLSSLVVRSGTAVLELAGRAAWSPLPSFDVELSAEGFDPGTLWSDWPGELRLAGRFAGTAPQTFGTSWRFEGEVAQLTGLLRGFPVSAAGRLLLADNELQLDGIALSSGANQLEADGRIGDDIDLALVVQAPELAALLPELQGQFSGTAFVSGSRTEPRLQADFSGRELSWREYGLAAFSLLAALEGNGTGLVRVNGDGLRGRGVHLDQLAAECRGDVSRHEATLSLQQGGSRRLQLAMAGGWQEERWQGEVRDLLLEAADAGRWRLPAPAALVLERERVRLAPLGLAGPNGAEIAVEADWREEGGLEAKVGLQGMQLAFFSPWLPEALQLAGELSGEVELRGEPTAPQGTGGFTLTGGVLTTRLEGEDPLSLTLQDTSADFSVTPGGGSLRFSSGLAGDGQVQAELAVADAADGRYPLQGRLTARLPDLSPLGGLFIHASGVEGQFLMDAELGGSVDAPLWEGEARLSGLAARVPELGLFLREGWLHLSASKGASPVIEGGMRSGEGELQLRGYLTPQPGFSWPLTLRVSGDSFLIADLPEARVWVSPDVHLEGAGSSWQLEGTALVPRAQFSLEDLPDDVVRRSPDEVLAGDVATLQGSKKESSGFGMRMRLELGEEVRLHGFGLSSRLTGDLLAESGNGLTSLNGQLNLEDGRYDAYGQHLSIDQGRLIFTGPVFDPGLDLRATRPLPDSAVKPYLYVRGRASTPQVTVSSEPPLPEAEALAWLLTGRPLNRAGQQEGSAMAEAALAFGVSRAEPWLRQLGAQFGLDTLAVQSTTGAWGRSALAVGTYLNPDLYLGYAAGLFDPGGAMLLRLRLGERLELETRAGTQSSADLFYRVEKK